MLKIIKNLFLTAVLATVAWAGYKFYRTKTMLAPYPYIVTATTFEGQDEAEAADILIVGDRMGVRLDRYTKDVVDRMSKGLRNPLKLYNWAREHEGMHRTLAKIKALKKFPHLIIYHGATEEFYEKKYFIQRDRNTILENIKRYQDERWISLIMTVPMTSRLIYQTPHYYPIGEKIVKNSTVYPSKWKQYQIELNYKLYELEIRDFYSWLKDKKSSLIVIPPPLNLEISPRLTCENASTNSIELEQAQIELYLKKKDYKQAVNLAKKLATVTIGNARSFYLLGEAAKRSGLYPLAKNAYYKAMLFDCATWRGNMIFNKIMVTEADKRELTVIDFNRIVNSQFGQDALFFDEFYPQDIYYNRLMEELEKQARAALSL